MNYAVMPMADYKAACDKLREKTETAELIKSGELPQKIDEVYREGQLSVFLSSEVLQGKTEGNPISITDVSPVEHDLSVKLSSDTLTDFSSVKVTACGKNLFNPSLLLETPNGTKTGWEYENGYYFGQGVSLRNLYNVNGTKYERPLVEGFAENTQYTLSFKGYNDSDTAKATVGFLFMYDDGKSTSVYLNTDKEEKTFTVASTEGKTVVGVYATYANNPVAHIKDIQIEEGEVATEYGEYKSATYPANADGTVSGVKSIYPIMNISSDAEVSISAEYFKDIDKVLENLAINTALSGGE